MVANNGSMRFLVSVISSPSLRSTQEEIDAVEVVNDDFIANGHWVFACGLAEPSESTLIDNRDGANEVVHRPFVDTHEFIAGFWILEAPDHETALRLALAGSKACNRKVELRPLLEGRPEVD